MCGLQGNRQALRLSGFKSFVTPKMRAARSMVPTSTARSCALKSRVHVLAVVVVDRRVAGRRTAVAEAMEAVVAVAAVDMAAVAAIAHL